MNLTITLFILVSVTLSVVAQILLKAGMSNESVQSSLSTNVTTAISAIATNYYIIFGLTAYVTSAAVWLIVLSKTEVSKAYPYVGLGFIGTMLFAYWFLNEPLSTTKIIGTLLITLGVIVISQ